MQNREYNFLQKCYDRACGQLHSEKRKTWIIDIDKDEVIWLPQVIDAIQPCMPEGNKIITQIPSKTGIHLITYPFNVMQYKENLKKELGAYQMPMIEFDIHKDNPTNLYIS